MTEFMMLTAVHGLEFWNALDPAHRHGMLIHFWENVCMRGGFLLLFVTGAGAISVDAAWPTRFYNLRILSTIFGHCR